MTIYDHILVHGSYLIINYTIMQVICSAFFHEYRMQFGRRPYNRRQNESPIHLKYMKVVLQSLFYSLLAI